MYKIPEDLDSKYRFVTLAAKRAEQLQGGALPRVAATGMRKPTVVAQQEVAEGLVDLWSPEDETQELDLEALDEEE